MESGVEIPSFFRAITIDQSFQPKVIICTVLIELDPDKEGMEFDCCRIHSSLWLKPRWHCIIIVPVQQNLFMTFMKKTDLIVIAIEFLSSLPAARKIVLDLKNISTVSPKVKHFDQTSEFLVKHGESWPRTFPRKHSMAGEISRHILRK